MKRAALLFGLLILAACGGPGSAPKNLDDACSIVRQNPTYLKAFKKTQGKWGIPVALQMAVIYQESKFRAKARTPFRYSMGVIPMGRQSSAYGYSQALDATWDEYRRKTRSLGAKRHNIGDATDFMGWYMNQSYEKVGISKTDTAAQYLAYHEGHTGYSKRTYRKKPWLVRISKELESRAFEYHTQLIACGKL